MRDFSNFPQDGPSLRNFLGKKFFNFTPWFTGWKLLKCESHESTTTKEKYNTFVGAGGGQLSGQGSKKNWGKLNVQESMSK